MTPEAYYDQHIAPKLAALATEAREHGLSFLAFVEYEPGAIAETQAILPSASLGITMLRHCARQGTNVDAYIIGLTRYCQRERIDMTGSMVLSRFVPSENNL